MQKSRVATIGRFLGTTVCEALVLLALTRCTATPPPEATRAVPTPTIDPLDPCAGVASSTRWASSTPEAVALGHFNAWSQFPARNVRARTLVNDGAFARVVVCAEVQHGFTDVWEEFSGDYGLSFVRGQWTVQDEPLILVNRFMSVQAHATQQASDQAKTARLLAALSGRAAIQGSVVTIKRVRDQTFGQYYWAGSLELRSTDGQEHTVVLAPEFTATLRQCTSAELEGVASAVSLDPLFSSKPKLVIGPDPIQHDSAFSAMPKARVDLFVPPEASCQELTDARDLHFTFEEVDGVNAFQLETAEHQLPRVTVVPATTPEPTAMTAATAVTGSSEAMQAPGVASSSAPNLITIGLGIALPFIAAASIVWAALARGAAVRSRRLAAPSGVDAVDAVPASRTVDAAGGMPVDNAPALEQPHVPVAIAADASDVAPLTVRCFGAMQVLAGDRVLWPSRDFANEQRAWELLFFLAASPPEGVDRETVGAALWPEVDLADVAGSLRQLRRRLRLMLARAVPALPEGAPLEADTGRIYRLDINLVSSDVH